MSYWSLKRKAKKVVDNKIATFSIITTDEETQLNQKVSSTNIIKKAVENKAGAIKDDLIEEINCPNELYSKNRVISAGAFEETDESEEDETFNDKQFNDTFSESDNSYEEIQICDKFNLETKMTSDKSNEVSVAKSNTDDLMQNLAKWAVRFNITFASLAALLVILRFYFPDLPKDPRTVLGTQKYTSTYNIKAIKGGSYCHLGFSEKILKVLQILKIKKDLFVQIPSTIKLHVNIDGLPLFKSSNGQFWPILVKPVLPIDIKPILVGLYYGLCKPNSCNEFLEDFVAEFKILLKNGINFDQKIFKFCIDAVICDAPAKAFVKNVKSHSGYGGCDKCIQNGLWQGKMTFPEINSKLRTDESFNLMLDDKHHLGVSSFQELNVGMVSCFPLDYMHLVCLGVVRKLLLLWIRGPLLNRLSSRSIASMSDLLTSFVPFIGKDFARKPRSLREIDRWKATEFRQFLLYTGPIVLKGHLEKVLYDNFMLLHVAILMLISNDCLTYCDYADSLLHNFVSHFLAIYGKEMAVYNIHGLVHIASDCKKYGRLDNFSAFPFENFLQTIKKLIRKPNMPLQQVVNRINEISKFSDLQFHFNNSAPLFRKKHNSGPIPDQYLSFDQYQEVTLGSKSTTLTVSQGNNCIKIKGCFGLLQNILHCQNTDTTFLVVKNFSVLSDFYDYPLCSSRLGVYFVKNLMKQTCVEVLASLEAKCILLPHEDGFVVFPLPHSCKI